MRRSFLGALALAGAMAVGTAGPAAALTLKAATYLPPKHPVGLGYQAFADELKKDTGGKITVKIFHAESLLGAKAISDGVRDSVADVGFVTNTYTPSYYPHGVLLTDIAMVGDNDMAAAFAITEDYILHCPSCLSEYAKQNQVFLGTTSTAPYVLLSVPDVNSAEKLKGKKFRAGGALWDRFLTFAGATGVNIPTSEMYEGMSRGIIDGSIYAVGGLKTHGLGDVAKQVVMLKLGSFRTTSLTSFNMDTWKELTPDQRKAVFKAAAVAIVKSVNEYELGDQEGIQVGKEKKIPILEPDASLVKLRQDFLDKDLPGVVAHAKKDLGIPDADKFIQTYRDLYAKYEKLIQPLGTDQDKLVAVIYDEVFAKLDPAKFGVK